MPLNLLHPFSSRDAKLYLPLHLSFLMPLNLLHTHELSEQRDVHQSWNICSLSVQGEDPLPSLVLPKVSLFPH